MISRCRVVRFRCMNHRCRMIRFRCRVIGNLGVVDRLGVSNICWSGMMIDRSWSHMIGWSMTHMLVAGTDWHVVTSRHLVLHHHVTLHHVLHLHVVHHHVLHALSHVSRSHWSYWSHTMVERLRHVWSLAMSVGGATDADLDMRAGH